MGVKYGNENIVEYMEKEGITQTKILENVEKAFQGVLDALLIDTEQDHNSRETAHRVAKMYVNEIFKGRYTSMPKITAFPNTKEYDGLYTVGPIAVRSTCCHHIMPITGNCWVAVLPGKKVIGLSKFARVVDWICSRPSIQEELTEQIADVLEEVTEARGVYVVVKAEHGCCTHRGIRAHNSNMTTAVIRGEFRGNPELKKEALALFEEFI